MRKIVSKRFSEQKSDLKTLYKLGRKKTRILYFANKMTKTVLSRNKARERKDCKREKNVDSGSHLKRKDDVCQTLFLPKTNVLWKMCE